MATLSSQAHLSAASRPAVVIRATTGWGLFDLRELWGYWELLYFLLVRDIKVRYNQTVIGVVWAVLQPLAMMATFTLLFGRLAKIPSDGLPYPLFAYGGLLAWQLFSRTLTESTNSLLVNQRLITRVYFPRILVPISTTLAALVDFGISLLLFFALMLIYGVTPGWTVLWIPAFLALLLMTSLGVGFWLSSLSIEFRDVAHIMPFISQMWLFVTPVVYPSSLVPPAWRVLYGLNPMAGVVEGFRWSLLGGGVGPSLMLGVSSLVAAAVFISGIAWFRRRERWFVDAIGSR